MIQLRNNILIFGSNALRHNIVLQYERMGCRVAMCEVLPEDVSNIDEFVLLTDAVGCGSLGDSEAIELLFHIAEKLPDNGMRPIVHLLLQSHTTMWVLQTMDFPKEIMERMDVFPFIMEDVWAKNIMVRMPGLRGNDYPALDRIPIGLDSRQTVHLVIGGFDAQAEMVAIHAALVAHYPNYRNKDDKPLRTRITVIDINLDERRDAFIARYQNLFDNSFYRFVDVKTQKTFLHRPMYYGRRMDFVDVEWEFVEGTLNDAVVREHLVSWATNELQQLSVVVSHNDDEQNLVESTSLPQQLYDKGVTVFLRQSNSMMAEMLKRSAKFASVYPFGMKDCGYDVSLPLWRLAKLLNYFYSCSYGDMGVPTELPQGEVEMVWAEQRSLKMRLSNLYNVMTIATKMHSLGHDPEDADTFYALTKKEIEMLSATEHNRWSVERLITGSRPCTDKEREEIRKDITRKKWYKNTKDTHYDLCAFDELQADETGKNVQTYDYDLTACIPLMAKTFFDLNAN